MDSIDWARERWSDAGEPKPDHLAAMAAILRLSQLVGAALDRSLREHEMSRTGYLILASLRITRDRTLAMSQLGRRLILHPTTISLVVDQLQTRGLVERRPHPSDRRTVLAILTGEGARVLHEISVAVSGTSYGLDGVTDRQAITLTEILRQVRVAIGDE